MYVYFAVSLVGEQWTERSAKGAEREVRSGHRTALHLLSQIDFYYPIFMTIKFLFYFGWLRVAETLYNPFGEDDDDFEINDLLNRHFRVAMAMVQVL